MGRSIEEIAAELHAKLAADLSRDRRHVTCLALAVLMATVLPGREDREYLAHILLTTNAKKKQRAVQHSADPSATTSTHRTGGA